MNKTFGQVAACWVDAKRPIVKHTTMCAYLLILNRQLLPQFSEHTLITEEVVQAYVLDKLSSGLSPKTVRDIISVLRSVVRYGERQHIFRDEHWEIRFPTSAKPQHLPTLTMKQHRKLLNHLLQQPTAQNVGVLLSLSLGLRIGEVCGLCWEDIDLQQGVMYVKRTVSRIYNCELGATERIVSSPKTKYSFREIPLTRTLVSILRHLRTRAQHEFVVNDRKLGAEPRAYRAYFKRLLHQLDLPHIVFHGLRHTFATRCIESQCDCKTVSTILGHAHVATTLQLYVHPNIDQKKRCLTLMNKKVGLSLDE